jgi:hypothetical protein
MSISKFQDKLTAKLKKSDLSDTTITNYMKMLRIIYTHITGKPHIDMSSLTFLKDKDKVIKALYDNYEKTSVKTYLATILKILNISGIRYSKLYKLYTEEFLKLRSDLETTSNEKTHKQKENWVSMDALRDVQRRYKEDVDEFKNKDDITMREYNDLLSYLIVSLYLDAKPERSENYFNMEMVKSMKDATDDDTNYFVDDKCVFIFNKYKTASSDPHRGEPIKISPALKKVIDLYLQFRPTNAKCFVAKYNGACFNSSPDWTRRVQQAFGKYLDGKKISSSMMRNIYFTEKYKKSNDDKEADAREMKTSVKMIDKVYTKKN